MNDRFKEFNYEITTDPHFMDRQNAMTPDLHKIIERLYFEITEKKGNKQVVGKILKLIEKYPKNPQLKNFLSVAYRESGNMEKAMETNHWIVAEHPDYLFGKLNLAAEHWEKGEYEKMPGVLGRLMEIQDLYPDREVFHLSEVTGFNKIAILYFTAINNLEAAESRYEILEKIAPAHPDTVQSHQFLMQARIKAGFERFEEENKKKIRVKTGPSRTIKQKQTQPRFSNEGIALLYQKGLDIDVATLESILSLPRESLISDLEKILDDLSARFQYFLKHNDTFGWKPENMAFPMHTLFILGELKAEESLDNVLDVLRQDEDFLEFWFGDFITEGLWEPLYKIGQNQTGKLRGFITEPGIDAYVRAEISKVLQQIALHQPERRAEVISWHMEVLEFFIHSKIEDNVIDSDGIALIVSNLMDIQASEMLPQIEELFSLGYISKGICGDLEAVKESFEKPPLYDFKENILSIADRYHEISTTWYEYAQAEEDEEFSLPEDPEKEFTPYIKPKEPGRNDPCPCGSGKKYKKCCMGK
jgi:hypothetical protein